MGVVRREGKWRLDKQQDGVYEVTYEKKPQLKIITDDYEPTGFTDERDDFTIQTRQVASFSDVEQLFKETAKNGGASTGFGSPAFSGTPSTTNGDFDLDEGDVLSDLPPAGIFFVGAIVSWFLIQRSGLNFDSPVFLAGAAILLVPVGILGLTYRVYQTEGAKAAGEFLISSEGDESSTSISDKGRDKTEKTPPAPEKMKDNIFFDRAGQRCEWCEDRTNSPEIHHIKPRSEGGPNEYKNLIGLCPGCHSQADKGGISRTKLRGKVSRQMDGWSKPD